MLPGGGGPVSLQSRREHGPGASPDSESVMALSCLLCLSRAGDRELGLSVLRESGDRGDVCLTLSGAGGLT